MVILSGSGLIERSKSFECDISVISFCTVRSGKAGFSHVLLAIRVPAVAFDCTLIDVFSFSILSTRPRGNSAFLALLSPGRHCTGLPVRFLFSRENWRRQDALERIARVGGPNRSFCQFPL